MSYVKEILKEEHDRLMVLSGKYRDKVSGLPMGCASIKNRKGLQYLYLACRKGGKVCFEYVGPVSSDSAQAILKKIEQRNKYMAKLKQVEKDLREIEKAWKKTINSC